MASGQSSRAPRAAGLHAVMKRSVRFCLVLLPRLLAVSIGDGCSMRRLLPDTGLLGATWGQRIRAPCHVASTHFMSHTRRHNARNLWEISGLNVVSGSPVSHACCLFVSGRPLVRIRLGAPLFQRFNEPHEDYGGPG